MSATNPPSALFFHHRHPGLFFSRLCEMLGIVMSNQPVIFQEINEMKTFEFLDPHLLGKKLQVAVLSPLHLSLCSLLSLVAGAEVELINRLPAAG